MSNTNIKYSVPQPAPNPNNSKSIIELVTEDLLGRQEFGVQKYGTTLQAFNKRNALIDAYQEGLDLVAYLRQQLEENNQRKIDLTCLAVWLYNKKHLTKEGYNILIEKINKDFS